MFILGHLGIGAKIVSPFSRELPLRAVFLGTLLPDLIDKPLFLIYKFATGQAYDSGGIFSGTKTIGHAAVTTLLILGFTVWRKNKWGAGLVLGMASHLVLDMLFENIRGTWTPELLNTFLWPLLGWNFFRFKLPDIQTYAEGILELPVLIAELLGALLLGWEFWKGRRREEMVAIVAKGRRFLSKARRGRRRRRS